MGAAAHRRGDAVIRRQVSDQIGTDPAKWDAAAWQAKCERTEQTLAAERESMRKARFCIERLRAQRAVDADTIAELRQTIVHRQAFIAGMFRALTLARAQAGRWSGIVRDLLTSDQVQEWYADNPQNGGQP